MTDVESKLRQDITPASDAVPLFGPLESTNLTSRFDFWPVETAEGQNAVIGLAFDPDERPSAPDTPVDIVVSVLALVLDRQHARARRDAQ